MKNTNPKRQRGRGAKIKELKVKNFTVFEEATFEFSPGLNVIIGENGTGKSHLLKLMYALLKGSDDGRNSGMDEPQADAQASMSVMKKLSNVFLPEAGRLERLIRRAGAKGDAGFRLVTDGPAVEISIRAKQHRHDASVTSFEGSPQYELGAPCVFVPPQEVLALYEHFIGSYSMHLLSLDETYYDICVALNVPVLREEPAWAVELLRNIEKLIGGKVVLKGDRFYVGTREAHLVAAGHRKLAAIVRLISNGKIADGAVLFWDEPEAGLNPRLVTTVAKVVATLAAAGVQVFIATHDFLLSTELSLFAEYPTEQTKTLKPRFFALSRSKASAAVQVESGETIAHLQNNAILAEY
ncbi:MAG TPA: AAA family ATPase, partial [Pirellulales bacterium]|nr:AAA family ATPase [Pirellulales bacterium]